MFRRLVDTGFYTTEAGFYHNEPKWLLQGGGFLYDKPSPFGRLPVEYRCALATAAASLQPLRR